MNENTGAPYEYVTSQKKTKALLFRRVTLVGIYLLCAVLFVLVGSWINMLIPFLILSPVLIFLLFFITWRLTQVVYEFSFFDGTVTVARILGGKSRRVLCKLSMRNMETVLPCDADDCDRRIESFAAGRTVFAGSYENSPTLFVALCRDEDNCRVALYFEPTARALRIIRSVNFSAVSRECMNRELP